MHRLPRIVDMKKMYSYYLGMLTKRRIARIPLTRGSTGAAVRSCRTRRDGGWVTGKEGDNTLVTKLAKWKYNKN